MEDTPVTKEPDADAGPLPLGYLRTEFAKQRQDVGPLDVRRHGVREDLLEGFKVFSLHPFVVLQSGTNVKNGEGFSW